MSTNPASHSRSQSGTLSRPSRVSSFYFTCSHCRHFIRCLPFCRCKRCRHSFCLHCCKSIRKRCSVCGSSLSFLLSNLRIVAESVAFDEPTANSTAGQFLVFRAAAQPVITIQPTTQEQAVIPQYNQEAIVPDLTANPYNDD